MNNEFFDKLKFSGILKWITFLFLSLIFLFISIIFILEADFFADNIILFPNDPYIYWAIGWFLFVLTLPITSITFAKFIMFCFKSFYKRKFENYNSEVVSE